MEAFPLCHKSNIGNILAIKLPQVEVKFLEQISAIRFISYMNCICSPEETVLSLFYINYYFINQTLSSVLKQLFQHV